MHLLTPEKQYEVINDYIEQHQSKIDFPANWYDFAILDAEAALWQEKIKEYEEKLAYYQEKPTLKEIIRLNS